MKTLLVAGMALFLTLAAVGNITMPDVGFGAVKTALVWLILGSIAASELAGAVLCWIGAARMWPGAARPRPSRPASARPASAMLIGLWLNTDD